MLSPDARSFGEIILSSRKEKNWTVRDLISRIAEKATKAPTPAYITRIEQYGEIPSPGLICVLADIFKISEDTLFEAAKKEKIKKVEDQLQEKFRQASGLYRTHRSKK